MSLSLRTGLGERLISTSASAKESAFTSLPIIDLTDLTSPDLEKRKALAGVVQKAAIDCGFFYIKNHGIPPTVMENVFAQAKLYFAQPLEEKMKQDMHLGDSFKGYTPLCGEQVDPDSRGDMHEAFDFGSDTQSFSAEKKSSGNQWPPAESFPHFKPALEEAWDQIMALGQRMFPLFALALDLPEDYFTDKLTNPGSTCRVISYPSQEGEVDLKSLGIGAHTDYECFTILAQDEVEALQVLNPAGEWIAAPPIKDTFVVNIADQLQRWTNDIFRSTVHRAINRTGAQRQSMPFFFGVDYDVEIDVLPICITPDRPAKYPPIKAGLWVEQRLAETYVKTPVV